MLQHQNTIASFIHFYLTNKNQKCALITFLCCSRPAKPIYFRRIVFHCLSYPLFYQRFFSSSRAYLIEAIRKNNDTYCSMAFFCFFFYFIRACFICKFFPSVFVSHIHFALQKLVIYICVAYFICTFAKSN